MKHFLHTFLTSFTIVLLSSYLGASHVSANTLVFSEDFSSNFSQWQHSVHDQPIWKIINGKAEAFIATSYTSTELTLKDEIWQSHWENLEYSFDYLPLTNTDHKIILNIENDQDWYELHFLRTAFSLVRIHDGRLLFDLSYPYDLPSDYTYRLKFRFRSGLLQVYINESLVAQQFDLRFNKNRGKVGIKVLSLGNYPVRVQFDNVQISLLTEDGQPFSVPRYSQHDIRWGDEVYDSAQKWSSNPTITRWGCALTSAVIILRYYGINWLPDGVDLNPLTLNLWLQNQADGYLQNGLVNWLAISRLTQLVSQVHDTPKLEYQRVTENIWSTAETEFSQLKPVIVEVVNHFVVGNGKTAEPNDMWITDPFYDYQKLSQHTLSPLSMRVFSPSQTDLSYLLITSATNIDLTLMDSSNQVVSEAEKYFESLTSSDGDELSPHLNIIQIAKPSTQEFHLLLQAAENKEYQVKIYHYDTQGQVKVEEKTGTLDSSEITITINYQKEPILSWQVIQETLQHLKQTGFFARNYYFHQLHLIAKYAVASSLPNQVRYTYLFLELLKGKYPSLQNQVQQLQAQLDIIPG